MITTKDLARLAGVSQSTVSRSLNNSPSISEKTRNRILQIAQEQGFEFNANARGLSTNRTDTIGIIYPEDFTDLSYHLFLSFLHNDLRESLERKNFDMITSFAQNRFSGANNIKKLIIQRKVDGLIIVRSRLDPETMTFLQGSGIPFVFLHYYDPSIEQMDRVYTDHLHGGMIATEHLLSLGHKRILCITTAGEGTEYEYRTDGYRLALQKYGIGIDEKLILQNNGSFKATYNQFLEEPDRIKGVTAIFAQKDIMALGVIEALAQMNIRVPKDIAMVGYDNIELGTYFRPYLTTVHQPREQITRLACERLLELIASKRVKRGKEIKIRPKLIIRESCGAFRDDTPMEQQ